MDARSPLPRVQAELLTASYLRGLLHDLLTLRQDQLDVARVRHVRVDLRHAVSTVSPLRLPSQPGYLDIEHTRP